MIAFFNTYRRPLTTMFRSIGIIIVVSGLLLAFSFVVSSFLYYWLAPLKGISMPIYFRQGDSGVSQTAIVDILSHQSEWNPSDDAVKLVRRGRVLSAGYRYRIALHLTMPQQLTDQQSSTSDISMSLIADDGTFLGSSYRSLTPKLSSNLHYWLKSIFWWPFVVSGLYSDDVIHTVFMSTSFIERRLYPLSHINLNLSYYHIDATRIKTAVLEIDRYNNNYLIDYPLLFISLSTMMIFVTSAFALTCGLIFVYTDNHNDDNNDGGGQVGGAAAHGRISTRIAVNRDDDGTAAEAKQDDGDATYDEDEFQDSWDGIMADDSKR